MFINDNYQQDFKRDDIVCCYMSALGDLDEKIAGVLMVVAPQPEHF